MNKSPSTPVFLKIENLAPYLAHKLRCRFMRSLLDYNLSSLFFNSQSKEMGCFIIQGIPVIKEISDFKPLLVPMDRLTQEELRNAGFDSHIDYLTHELDAYRGGLAEVTMAERIAKAPHDMVVYLQKNHYDYQDLIRQGLAIEKPI